MKVPLVQDLQKMISDYTAQLDPADLAALDRARKMVRDDAVDNAVNPSRPTYALGVGAGVNGFLYLLESEDISWFLDRIKDMRGGDKQAARTLFVLACAVAIDPNA